MSPRAVTTRTPAQAVLAVVLEPLRLASSNTLPVTSVQSKVGSGTTRTVAVASPDIALPRQAVQRLRAVHVLALGDARADREQQLQRVLPMRRSSSAPFHASSRPATVGSIGTPSRRAEPST